jgi:type I restriction enzyme M protein
MRTRYSTLFTLDSSMFANEAQVETRFVAKLLKELGYPDSAILPKSKIKSLIIRDGVATTRKEVDFILKDSNGSAFAIVEVKSPSEELTPAWGQAASYALSYNKDLKNSESGIEWLLLTNGLLTALYPINRATPLVTLRLEDFASGSPPFVTLKTYLKHVRQTPPQSGQLPFGSMTPAELNKLFDDCHNLIWKKEKLSPTDAFYEFCKFIFIKIREDKKRFDLMEKGVPNYDLRLTEPWLKVMYGTTKHPIRDILFAELREELEKAIHKHGKKRIFEKTETLRLSASTCEELVKKFQTINLSAIDEDLNGRMFERFLNQAVRGKELGQYFTPRSVVDFMTRIALEDCDILNPPKTIDACCGTGGFLIEVMAYLVAKARNDTRFTKKNTCEALIKRICDECLYGVEGNERVARIARINMYLHGDGGSHIFHGDGLDTNPMHSDDMTDERKDEISDHAIKLTPSSFDLVLTNPPFSMSYDRNNKDEEAILVQRPLADGLQKAKSNLLFLDRYHELLKPGGQMLVVLDDTVINGKTLQSVREWILKNFVLVSIHSLPFNAFFKAQANIKTSIIHLRKKMVPDEEQGYVFMSIANNIGHDNSLNDTPDRNNMVDILMSYFSWRDTGKIQPIINQNHNTYENLECPQQVWLVPPSEIITERFDAFYYSPDLKKARATLSAKEKDKLIEIKKGSEFQLAPRISKARKLELKQSGQRLRYIEIGDVTSYGLIVKSIEGTIDELPSRGEYEIKEGDVLMAINNSSRGTVVLVPKEFEGTICTSGFLVLRPRNKEEGKLLWYALRSEYCRNQIYYLAQTASQPELKMEAWNSEFIIPLPKGIMRATALAETDKFHEHISALSHASEIKFQ